MKFVSLAFLCLAGLITGVYAALTKGTIQIKAPSAEKGVTLSTLFDEYDADVIASDNQPALQVQIDLERAQSEDSDIEILVRTGHSSDVGCVVDCLAVLVEWILGTGPVSLFRRQCKGQTFTYLAANVRLSRHATPERMPADKRCIGFTQTLVSSTCSKLQMRTPQQKENAFTACYPNGMRELPFQASAVWRYDPTSRKLTPKVLALNGTQLPVVVAGGWYEGNFHFNAISPSDQTGEPLTSFHTRNDEAYQLRCRLYNCTSTPSVRRTVSATCPNSQHRISEYRSTRTKGTVQIKAPSAEKGVTLSTFFDDYDADIIATENQPALQVQIDLERAQKEDSDIEILNGFWVPTCTGTSVSVREAERILTGTQRKFYPIVGFINVQQTPDAYPLQKENAFTACYPNGMQELPFQASAIWRYDPANRKLTPKILALNGTQLPVIVDGGWYEGNFGFSAVAPSNRTGEPLEFFFVPETE
ncbi:hypothetical protein NMY22_g3769 [Coprinellus aureogranulatus]|nr:hypothetical protein NMY22_g3769 [Coprinellus aureogranulatus]